MRLSDHDLEIIRNQFLKWREQGHALYLFGSRVDPTKKGGDIDLLIIASEKRSATLFDRLEFVVALKKELGDRRIDVTVTAKTDLSTDPFLEKIFATAVEL